MHTTSPAPSLVWEKTLCPLCGSDCGLPVADIPEMEIEGVTCRVVRCRECGLTYSNPRPSEDTIYHIYQDNYAAHSTCGLSEHDRRRAVKRLQRSSWRSWHPQRHGMAVQGQGRLLDFGCGGGAFLELMHRQGWKVLGLDLGSQVVENIRTKLNLPVTEGTLPRPDLPPESFDVVSMWHSLEHVHRPLEVLQEAARLLVPGGRLLVGVPNVGSAPRYWYGGAWCGWRLPHHLTHFSPDTLRRMVERAGFRIERLITPGNPFFLRESAATARDSGQPWRWQHWMTNRFLSRRVAEILGWTQRSDEMVLIAAKPQAARVAERSSPPDCRKVA